VLSISLPFLIVCSLVVSAGLIWMNLRRAGALAAASATLAVSSLIAFAQFAVLGRAMPTGQDVQFWLLFVVTPSSAVWAISRLGVFRSRPWWLLLAGPMAHLVAVTVVMVLYNVLFASTPR